jgi:hypothetical protein
MRVELPVQIGSPCLTAEEPYSGRNRTRGRATRAVKLNTLKKSEGQESFCFSNRVKPIGEGQNNRAGLKLQGRLKPMMGADSRKRIRGLVSGIIAGKGNPLWCSKRECEPEGGRNPCEAGNGEGAGKTG